MQELTITEISKLTGVRPGLWRAAMRRYELFAPVAKRGRSYFYSLRQLSLLFKLSFLHSNGYSLKELITIDAGETDDLVESVLPVAALSTWIPLLLEAGLDFKEDRLMSLLSHCATIHGLQQTISGACYPYLVLVTGSGFSKTGFGALAPFAEPVFCRLIIIHTAELPAPATTRKMILFTTGPENSELKLLYINYLLREKGFSTIYLSPAAGITDLKKISGREKAEVIWIYMQAEPVGLTADDYLEILIKKLPGCRFVITGAGIQDSQRNFVAAKVLKRDEQVYEFINGL